MCNMGGLEQKRLKIKENKRKIFISEGFSVNWWVMGDV